MLEYIVSFILIMISAATMENIVFTRAFGINNANLKIKSIKQSIIFGGIVTLILTFSSIINIFLGDILSLDFMGAFPSYKQSISMIISVLITFIIISLILFYYSKEIYNKYNNILTMASFNCSIHAVLIIESTSDLAFGETIAYSLGAGLGFMMALILIYFGRQRLSLLKTPRAFKGLPIMLIYLGILSLAIYGLIGHQLPS